MSVLAAFERDEEGRKGRERASNRERFSLARYNREERRGGTIERMIERELKLTRERERGRGTYSTKGNCCCNLLHSLADTLSNKIRRRLCSVRAGEITSLRTKWTEI